MIQKVFCPLTMFKKKHAFNFLRQVSSGLFLSIALVSFAGCAAGTSDTGVLDSGRGLQSELSAGAVLRLAEGMERQGDYGSAMNLYQRAMGYSMRSKEQGDKALMDAAMAGYIRMGLRTGLLDQIEENYAGWFEVGQGNEKVIAAYVEALLRADRVRESGEVLEKHMTGGLESADLWNLKGVIADLALQHGDARNHYDRALTMAPQKPMAIVMNMALSYALTGDFETARGLVDQAQAAPSLTANRASIEALAGNIEAATALMRPQLSVRELRSNTAFYQLLQDMTPQERARAVLLGIAD